MSQKERLGRHALVEQLVADGIKCVFGNPGSTEQGFLSALFAEPSIDYVGTLHEGVAVAMADGYARALRRPALVQLHAGVGLGNGLGMMHQAHRARTPLVVLAGEAGLAWDAMDCHIAADLVAMARPVTKWATRVVHQTSLLRLLRRAFKVAATPPQGPVFLALPQDLLDLPTAELVEPTSFIVHRAAPPRDVLLPVAELLARAERPLFIIGDGVALAEAQTAMTRIVEQVGAEVWGNAVADVDFDVTHPQFCGVLGYMDGRDSRPVLERADVVLVCGGYILTEVYPSLDCPFDPAAKIIHIDTVDWDIAKNHRVDIGLSADPATTCGALAEILESILDDDSKQRAAARREALAARRADWLAATRRADELAAQRCPLHFSSFLEELVKQLPDDAVIFDEAVTGTPSVTRYLPPRVPGHYFGVRGGSLGNGIPGSIGVKFACPQRMVVGFSGDGAAMFTPQALWTAARYNIIVLFVVLNNGRYGVLDANFRRYEGDIGLASSASLSAFDLRNPPIRYDELAQSLGVAARRLERQDEIAPVLQQAFEHKGPFLIELMLSQQVSGPEALRWFFEAFMA